MIRSYYDNTFNSTTDSRPILEDTATRMARFAAGYIFTPQYPTGPQAPAKKSSDHTWSKIEGIPFSPAGSERIEPLDASSEDVEPYDIEAALKAIHAKYPPRYPTESEPATSSEKSVKATRSLPELQRAPQSAPKKVGKQKKSKKREAGGFPVLVSAKNAQKALSPEQQRKMDNLRKIYIGK